MGIRRPTQDASRPPIPQSNVRVVQFFAERLVQTDGTANWREVPIDAPEVLPWDPYLFQIVPVTESRNDTANFEWKVVVYWSMDGSEWTGPTDLFAPLSAGPGRAIQSAFTDASKMGPQMRYAVAVRNSGGGAIESAELSCSCYFEFRT